MSSALASPEVDRTVPRATSPQRESAEPLHAEALLDSDKEEILTFLRKRPIHTVCMASYIQDHGVVSPFNRGVFYGCRNLEGKLAGVALIGHATLLESDNDEAIKAFAHLKRQYLGTHLVRGQHDLIARFWKHFDESGKMPERSCRESLFEQTKAKPHHQPVPQLRPATLTDLESIVAVNAKMIQSECGVDPLAKYPTEFRERIIRRIDQGRVWVWTEKDQLIFKADAFAETREMVYLEGVHVHPDKRGQGIGLRCMSQLSHILLERSNAICLLVNEKSKELGRFYENAGYEFRDTYDTIYLDTP